MNTENPSDPLEARALNRDRRFLVRLVLLLVVGALAGLWMFAQLTDGNLAHCAAQAFGTVAGSPFD